MEQTPPIWLTGGTPIAHRGLHGRGLPENTLGAFSRAVQEGYPIELDLQLTGDGHLVVFHDRDLKRLMSVNRSVTRSPLASLQSYRILDTNEKIPTLKEVLEVVDGKVPLLIEMKAAQVRVEDRALALLRDLTNYRGPVALQSFDGRIVRALKRRSAYSTGLIVHHHPLAHEPWRWTPRSSPIWPRLARQTPYFYDFVAHNSGKLYPALHEELTSAGVPLITWTVRSQQELTKVKDLANNFIFEGFCP